MVVTNKICFKSKDGSDISGLEIPEFLKPKLTLLKPYYDKKYNMIFTRIDKYAFDEDKYPGYVEKEKINKWAEENNLIITSEHEEI